MNDDVTDGAATDVAAALLASLSVLFRRIRQVPAADELTLPERRALSRLARDGAATSAELARQEEITAQAMGATTGALQARGLVERRRDPDDGRRVVLSATDAGRQALTDKRNARTELVAHALTSTFTAAEREALAVAAPLLERLARCI